MKSERLRRRFAAVFLLGIIAVTVLLLWGFVVEPWRLVVRRQEIVLPGNGVTGHFRAVVISDTHFGGNFLSRLRMRRIVRKTQAEKPDAVFLLGDYVAAGASHKGGGASAEDLSAFFRGLVSASHGKAYAVLGNHELLYGRARMSDLLNRAGVAVVENANRRVRIGNTELFLAGIVGRRAAPPGENLAFEGVDFSLPVLTLLHAPDALWRIPRKSALALAGHTHGSQIHIPGYGGIFRSWQKAPDPGLSRHFDRLIFVTSGAGGHRLNFRLFCPPEIVVLDIIFK